MKVGDLVRHSARIYIVEVIQGNMHKIKSMRPYWPTEWVDSKELTLVHRCR